VQQQTRQEEHFPLWIFERWKVGEFSWFIWLLQLQFLQLL
jgi:hypothetical protein